MPEAKLEQILAEYVTGGTFDKLSPEVLSLAQNMVLTEIGTIMAGAMENGIEELVGQVKEWGGREEATILMHGGRVPAHNAAFVNSAIARALDFDDSMTPGIHIGTSTVPTALAVAELIGGCSGKELLTALVLGSELGARLNLRDEQYHGFDPTGVCTVFATTAVAGRLLGLNPKQMLNALAIAFNRSGGSYQSHISGSLAVRLVQGFVAQSGIMCAQLAQIGMTGPADFLTGIYGYFHLYGKDQDNTQATLNGLGERFELVNTMFKKYPSCAATHGSTDAILAIIAEHSLTPEEVLSIDIYVTPATYRLAGKPFEIGDNPKVDAQFSIQYCVANALLRRSSRLEHFNEAMVREPVILDITKKINVFADSILEKRGHTAVDMQVKRVNGGVYRHSLDIASGVPGNPLSQEDHINRFKACIEYAADYFPQENAGKLVSFVENLAEVEDVRTVIPLLMKR